jgi:hypothetical protein
VKERAVAQQHGHTRTLLSVLSETLWRSHRKSSGNQSPFDGPTFARVRRQAGNRAPNEPGCSPRDLIAAVAVAESGLSFVGALFPAQLIEHQDMSSLTASESLLQRIRREFLENPALRLTPWQFQRLLCLDADECQIILRRLVQMRFLRAGPDGTFVRHSAETA